MIVKVLSSEVLGVDAYLVEVEVDIAFGFPQFNMVGLPERAVKESKARHSTCPYPSAYSLLDKKDPVQT